jgi:hypothetical protein
MSLPIDYVRRGEALKCRFFKREKGSSNKNVCMAEFAILGEAGDTYNPADSEAIDVCLSEVEFKKCNKFQWVEREKDKETLKSSF